VPQGVKPLNPKRQPAAALDALPSEAVNPRTHGLDQMSTRALLRTLQREDATVAAAVRRALPQIAAVLDALLPRFLAGGRLVYVGAGTSGRLGVLDAAECPPTFGISPSRVRAVIAGGARALTRSVEGAEDHPAAARHDLARLRLRPHDSVVGLAASGRTPYTLAALAFARRQGCLTVALANVPHSPLAAAADLAIEPLTGPEALAGSTRLKAGTAQKMVLNLLSTALMARSGRVVDNLMVGVQPTNAKLRQRARRIKALLRARQAGSPASLKAPRHLAAKPTLAGPSTPPRAAPAPRPAPTTAQRRLGATGPRAGASTSGSRGAAAQGPAPINAQRRLGAMGPQAGASTSGSRGAAAQGPAPINAQRRLGATGPRAGASTSGSRGAAAQGPAPINAQRRLGATGPQAGASTSGSRGAAAQGPAPIKDAAPTK